MIFKSQDPFNNCSSISPISTRTSVRDWDGRQRSGHQCVAPEGWWGGASSDLLWAQDAASNSLMSTMSSSGDLKNRCFFGKRSSSWREENVAKTPRIKFFMKDMGCFTYIPRNFKRMFAHLVLWTADETLHQESCGSSYRRYCEEWPHNASHQPRTCRVLSIIRVVNG